MRALVKHLDGLSDAAIVDVNIPTGVPLVYDLADDFTVRGKWYLGNEDEIGMRLAGAASNPGQTLTDRSTAHTDCAVKPPGQTHGIHNVPS